MVQRMFCTSCARTAEPDTVLDGSDLVELLGWCVFAVPGWLYCVWRHVGRRKACAFCGSGELIREARATRRRMAPQAPSSHGPRVLGETGPASWPRGLATPRERLRHGGVGAALVVALLLSWALAATSLAAARSAAGANAALTLLCASWMLHQIARVRRLRRELPGCRAWDGRGRPVSIELL